MSFANEGEFDNALAILQRQLIVSMKLEKARPGGPSEERRKFYALCEARRTGYDPGLESIKKLFKSGIPVLADGDEAGQGKRDAAQRPTQSKARRSSTGTGAASASDRVGTHVAERAFHPGETDWLGDTNPSDRFPSSSDPGRPRNHLTGAPTPEFLRRFETIQRPQVPTKNDIVSALSQGRERRFTFVNIAGQTITVSGGEVLQQIRIGVQRGTIDLQTAGILEMAINRGRPFSEELLRKIFR